MISLFGAGGGGGAWPDAALLRGPCAIWGAASEPDWLFALIWCEFESFAELPAVSESSETRVLRLFLPRLAALSARARAGIGIGPLEFCVATGAATAAACSALPTCKLLTTSLTPVTDPA